MSKSKIHILPNYEQTDLKTAIVSHRQTKDYSQYNSVTVHLSFFVNIIMFSFVYLEQNLTELNEMHITNYKCALVLCQFHFCQRLLLIFLHSSYQMFHINFPPTSFDANFLVSFQKIYAAFHKRVRTFLKIVYHTKSPNITWSQGYHSRFLADKTVIVAARQLGVPLLTSFNPQILGKTSVLAVLQRPWEPLCGKSCTYVLYCRQLQPVK